MTFELDSLIVVSDMAHINNKENSENNTSKHIPKQPIHWFINIS